MKTGFMGFKRQHVDIKRHPVKKPKKFASNAELRAWAKECEKKALDNLGKYSITEV